ncbi:MAG: aminoacyl-tRNA hydrolase [Spirochaetales bacterium]|nr:aminoacyl-tRNA hydrolase [Spirochaetales bacterium]
MIRLLVFLGNPGREYEKTRHNAAWLVAENLPFYATLSWQEKWKGRYAVFPGGHTGEKPLGRCTLLLPQTYMNLSGNCVRACMDFLKIETEELLVVHDEIELPFGTISFKQGGGSAGHNGLRSIQKNLPSAGFWRLRLGIDRPARGDVNSYVLGRFSREEEIFLDTYLKKAAAILLECAVCPEAGSAGYGKLAIGD